MPEGRRFDRVDALTLASRIAEELGHHDEAVEHAEGAVSAARDLEDRDALREALRHLSILLEETPIQTTRSRFSAKASAIAGQATRTIPGARRKRPRGRGVQKRRSRFTSDSRRARRKTTAGTGVAPWATPPSCE